LPGAHDEYTSAVSIARPPAATKASSTAKLSSFELVQPKVLPPSTRGPKS